MWNSPRKLAAAVALAAAAFTSLYATAHGNVVPQAVDTTGLPPLGDKWRDENPFETNKLALKFGASAYNQNCARCHGLEAISGGIAPDLRLLDRDCTASRTRPRSRPASRRTITTS